MNRRGFLGALFAAPLAAVAGLRPRVRSWVFGDGLRHRPTATGTMAHPHKIPSYGKSSPQMADETTWDYEKIYGRAEAAGKSFKYAKGRVAAEILK